jgi:predicted dehydrogenase
MSRRLRVGLLGAAKIAPRSLVAPAQARQDVELVCVAARERARAAQFAKTHGFAETAADYEAVLGRDDVDLVYVALPAAAHARWSIRALEAGKAVLCEKPFAMDAAQAEAMTDAAQRTGRPLLEAFHYRHHPVIGQALEMVRRGDIGVPQRAEAVFSVPIPFRETELRWLPEQGGGALMDLGCYCVHALRLVAAEEPAVTGASSVVRRGVDESTEAVLHFPGGLQARLACSMSPPGLDARLTIQGSDGAIEITNFMAPQIGCRFTVSTEAGRREIPVDPRPTFAWQLDHVVEVVLHGAAPLTGGADAVRTMRAIDAIRAAAAEVA